MAGETLDTMFGLMRRTGPAAAELIDPETGAVYVFDFAQIATIFIPPTDPREYTDALFLPNRVTDDGEAR